MSEIEIYGTTYKVVPNEREPGDVVEILGTPYEIFSNAEGEFRVYRIDPDGAAGFGVGGLSSMRAAIELAEIYERMIAFLVDIAAMPNPTTQGDERRTTRGNTIYHRT